MRVQEDHIITQHWRSFQEGHEQGLRFFFDRYYPSLCYFADRYVQNQVIAEDMVSESFVKVWEKRNSIKSPLAFKNYCYKTVRNRCLRWLQNEQQLQSNTQQLPAILYTKETALQNIIRSEVIEELHTAIKNLPARSSEVFTKLYVEGKTVAEAAKELQVTISTIKSHKRTGLSLLRLIITRVLILFLHAAFS